MAENQVADARRDADIRQQARARRYRQVMQAENFFRRERDIGNRLAVLDQRLQHLVSEHARHGRDHDIGIRHGLAYRRGIRQVELHRANALLFQLAERRQRQIRRGHIVFACQIAGDHAADQPRAQYRDSCHIHAPDSKRTGSLMDYAEKQ